ncbi:hypothetical protein HanRHA438_Chr16g0745141 [Helianthus annuus]|nr:hypothetical protein HanRHA438_Chr16g0745141 [Helianthus annuus]
MNIYFTKRCKFHLPCIRSCPFSAYPIRLTCFFPKSSSSLSRVKLPPSQFVRGLD